MTVAQELTLATKVPRRLPDSASGRAWSPAGVLRQRGDFPEAPGGAGCPGALLPAG